MAGITRLIEGETPYAVFLVMNELGVPVTGKGDVQIKIHRLPDDDYWTGSAWGAETWLTMTEDGDGMYRYQLPDTTGFDGKEFLVKYRCASEGAYGGEQYLIFIAATGLTVPQIAQGVWQEANTTGGAGTMGERQRQVNDVEVDTQDIQSRIPAALTGSGNIKSSIEEKNSAIGLTPVEKTDVNAEADTALADYDPPTKAELDTAEQNIRGVDNDDLKDISDEIDAVKADTAAILLDTDELQGKAPDEYIMGSAVTTSKDDEIDAIKLKTDNLPADPASQSAVETKIDEAVDELDGADNRDHTEIYDAILLIQNNTRLVSPVPDYLEVPDSGDKPIYIPCYFYDTTNNFEDPDNDEMLILITDEDGASKHALLFEDSGFTTPLGVATNQTKFPSGAGWRKLKRDAVGQFSYYIKLNAAEALKRWNVLYGYEEGGVTGGKPYGTQVAEVHSDLNDIQAKVNVLYDKRPDNNFMGSSVKTNKDDEIDDIQTKVTAILEDTETTLPAQITAVQEDIRQFPRMEVDIPEIVFVPTYKSHINQSGGLTDTALEVTVRLIEAAKPGMVIKIESEYILVGDVDTANYKLTSLTRGYMGTTPAAHADGTIIEEVTIQPLRLNLFQNDGDPVNADALPTLTVQDFTGAVEISAADWTLIEAGVYGYDYIIERSMVVENKIFITEATISGKTRKAHQPVIVLDEPASEKTLVESIVGGLGDIPCDQDGWWDEFNILHPWGDALAGPVEDADSGMPIDKALVSAYPIIGGVTKYGSRPTGETETRPSGVWVMFLNAGPYTFFMRKDGFRVEDGGKVDRTVG